MTDRDTLPIDALIEVAQSARQNSYAPYSGFRTGAAVLAEDGTIHRGALVENLVFGVAMCGERAAMFAAVAAGSPRLAALALVAPATAGSTTYPCGPCLQVAVELGGMDMPIIATDPDGDIVEIVTLHDLAPGLPHRKSVAEG